MKQIAFTFDDGPNTTITKEVLELFKQYNGFCTFFLIGQNINEESAKVSIEALEYGCEINNHSFTHVAFPSVSDAVKIEEIEKCDEAVEKFIGTKAKFFRPPYIAYDDATYDVVNYPFICGLGCDDWDMNVSIEKRIDEILKFAADGVIVLLHDMEGNYKTVEALKVVLPELVKQEYEFVTLSKLFESHNIKPLAHEKKIYSSI